MPAFSIIVPVYNAQKTLRRCLDSLRGQTFSDFEVLMIENGSSDDSNAICQAYASADGRFLLHTCGQNSGPSGARNIGLEHMRGQLVTFVDSDDYVTADYLERLHRTFTEQNAEVVFFGYRQVSMDETEIAVRIPQVSETASDYELLTALSQQDLFGYTWIKAFRASVIGDKRFSTELNLMEDEVFTCNVLEPGCRIAVLPEPVYYYVTGNAASLIGRTHQDFCMKLDAAYCAWKSLLAQCPDRQTLLRNKANACVSRCMYYGFERNVDPDAFFRQLARCAFFRDSDLESRFCCAVKAGNLKKLQFMRWKYRLKVAFSKLLRK